MGFFQRIENVEHTRSPSNLQNVRHDYKLMCFASLLQEATMIISQYLLYNRCCNLLKCALASIETITAIFRSTRQR